MKKKPQPKPQPEETPRPGYGDPPTERQFNAFVGKLLNVPRAEIEKRAPSVRRNPRKAV